MVVGARRKSTEEGNRRLSHAINGRVMIQYERSGVPSRISRWPTAVSLPLIVSFSANYATANSAILSNLTGLSAKLQLLDDFLVVDSDVDVSLTLLNCKRECTNGL